MNIFRAERISLENVKFINILRYSEIRLAQQIIIEIVKKNSPPKKVTLNLNNLKREKFEEILRNLPNALKTITNAPVKYRYNWQQSIYPELVNLTSRIEKIPQLSWYPNLIKESPCIYEAQDHLMAMCKAGGYEKYKLFVGIRQGTAGSKVTSIPKNIIFSAVNRLYPFSQKETETPSDFLYETLAVVCFCIQAQKGRLLTKDDIVEEITSLKKLLNLNDEKVNKDFFKQAAELELSASAKGLNKALYDSWWEKMPGSFSRGSLVTSSAVSIEFIARCLAVQKGKKRVDKEEVLEAADNLLAGLFSV